MYLLDSNDLGGHAEGPPAAPDRVFNSYVIGSCSCGQSYFRGTDGVGRVVSSGGNIARVWKVNTTANPSLSQESMSTPIVNGTKVGSAVVTLPDGREIDYPLEAGADVARRGVVGRVAAMIQHYLFGWLS
jgi:hypothetical protein